jgi:hypothetical protein
MIISEKSNGSDGPTTPSNGVQDRLALTRILIWAEQEAESLGADLAAGRIREAISALHHG